MSTAVGTSRTTRQAVCPYCGVGCRIRATVEDGRLTKVSADKKAAPNFGLLCQKGATLDAPGIWEESGRATRPMIREDRRMPLREVSWERAIAFVAERAATIRKQHGGDAFAFYGSGQLDTEASYLFTKLFKGALGTNNMDTNSRLCMSSAAAAYKLTFGADGPSGCYDDIRHADLFFVIGANMAVNHPVLFTMVRQQLEARPDAKLIVVDPRRTMTARPADIHLPVKPGGDVALVQYIARALIEQEAIDESFIDASTEGFEAYRDGVLALDPGALLAAAGLSHEQLMPVIDAFRQAERRLSFYCQGLNQSSSGTDKNIALINLHMQLGDIGRIGSGPFSLTGQPNAMGGREVGYLSHQLPGYRGVASADDRLEMERLWKLAPGSIANRPGLTAVDMFDAMGEGRIKGLWVAGTNPAVTMPDLNKVQRAFARADLIVVQDCYQPTETAAYAHAVLPAAQWGEKTGTMTNSERLVSRSEKFFDPPGLAMPDWWIVCRIAQALGLAGFDFVTQEQVWDEFITTTCGRPCVMTGITNRRLAAGSVHWPCADEADPGTMRRYTDGRFPTPSGRAVFFDLLARNAAEVPDSDYSLILTTGRVAAQWHTRTRTGKVPQLNAQAEEPFVELHPDDAATIGIMHGQNVRLVGRRGESTLRAVVTEDIRPGTVFTPFHWGDLFDSGASVNRITNDAYDPRSQQPELKFCAVRCEPMTDTVRDAPADTMETSR